MTEWPDHDPRWARVVPGDDDPTSGGRGGAMACGQFSPLPSTCGHRPFCTRLPHADRVHILTLHGRVVAVSRPGKGPDMAASDPSDNPIAAFFESLQQALTEGSERILSDLQAHTATARPRPTAPADPAGKPDPVNPTILTTEGQVDQAVAAVLAEVAPFLDAAVRAQIASTSASRVAVTAVRP